MELQPAPLVSDAEREAVVGRLREGCHEGRLTFDELGQRVERALQARTKPDLDVLVADLPGAATPAVPRKRRKPRRWFVGVIGESHMRGRWRLEEDVNVVGVIGEWSFDLRDAEIAGDEVTVNVWSLIGEVTIRLPRGADVEVSGFNLIGERHVDRSQPLPGMPRVHVRAFSLIGSVNVLVR